MRLLTKVNIRWGITEEENRLLQSNEERQMSDRFETHTHTHTHTVISPQKLASIEVLTIKYGSSAQLLTNK